MSPRPRLLSSLLVAAFLVAGCGRQGSLVVVTVTATSPVTVNSLTADVTAGGRSQSFNIPLTVASIPPNQTFAIEVPPDVSGLMTVTVQGAGLSGTGQVIVLAGGRADLTITLGSVVVTDGGVVVDLTTPPPDLAGADLAGADLITPPDLAVVADATAVLDLAVVADQTVLSDLKPSTDSIAPADQTVVQDLKPPPDLVVLDLVVVPDLKPLPPDATAPPDMTSLPGKLIFVTAAKMGGNLGGPGGADIRCQTDANRPNGSVYKALLVAGTTRRASITANAGDGQIDWVLKPNTPYRRPSGLPLMTTNSVGLFTFGTLANSWNGVAEGSWTGLTGTWTTSTTYNNCINWTSSLGTEYAAEGANHQVAAQAIFNSFNFCAFASPIICVEQ